MRLVPSIQISCGDNPYGQWEPIKFKSLTGLKTSSLWLNQVEALEQFLQAKNVLLYSPTGSGKTTISLLHNHRILSQDPNLRTVFAVPQGIISPGYKTHPEAGPILNTFDFCTRTERIEGLVDFLLTKRPDPNPVARRAVCTHMLLALAYKKLADLDRLDALEDLFLWVDEGHHIALDDESHNWLGKIVSAVLKSRNSRVGCMTAFPFREDRRCTTIPEEHLDEFSVYELPYDRYLGAMRNLKQFKIFFAYYRDSYRNAIIQMLKEDKSKAIVYLPAINWGLSTGDKHKDVEEILAALGASEPDGNGVQTLADGRKVLNLVTEYRTAQKAFLDKRVGEQALINAKKDALDIILTVGMAQEGFDWYHVERIIQVGARVPGSQLQINGRVLRDVADRPSVSVNILLPEASALADEDHERLANFYLLAVYSAMLIEDIYDPAEPSEMIGASVKQPRAHPLTQFFRIRPDVSFEDLAILAYKIIDSGVQSGLHGEKLYETYMKQMVDQVAKMGGGQLSRHVARRIWAMYVRRSIRLQSRKITSLDLQILERADPIAGLAAFCSETIGLTESVFAKVRQAILRRDKIPFSEFERLMVLNNINDQGAYKILRRELRHLPADPATAYPEFKSWSQFRGHGELLARFSEKFLSNGSSCRGRVSRKKAPKVPVETRYKDYLREVVRQGRNPLTLEEFTKKNG